MADAEFAYYDWQLHNGRDVLQRGIGPQDASELQNLTLYRQHEGIHESASPSEDRMPESFHSRDAFHPHGFPAGSVDDMHQPELPQPEELADLNSPEFIDPMYGAEFMCDGTVSVEGVRPASEHQAEAPTPDPMDDPVQDANDPVDPLDPMNPIGLDPFDPMDPMDMGGLVGP